MRLFDSLRAYRAAWLPGDLVAGVMLAAIAVPEQLATARLAGFPPEAGLFAFMAGSTAYAVFGRNPYMSIGADSTIAPIFAGAITAIVGVSSAQYAPLAGFLAVAVGVLLVIAGLARAGWMANLLSIPVTVGFLAGIAAHIVVGQLPALLGVPASNAFMLARLWDVLRALPQTNLFDLGIGVVVFGSALLASRVNRRIPGALIGLVGVTAAAYLWSFGRHGVQMLGAFRARLPSPHVPAIPSFDHLTAIAPLALVVAAVCIMQTSAVGRSFPSKTGEEDISADVFAVGMGSVLAGIFGAFPVDSSPPRTAIVKAAGGVSQLASLIGVGAILVVALVASPLLAYVPQAALAGVLVYIAAHIFRFGEIFRIAKYSRRELELMIVGALLVILLPIQTGMLLAIMLSLAHGVQMMMWPPATELVHVSGTTIWWPAAAESHGERIPGVLVFAPAAPINFTNAQYIHDRLLHAIDAAQEPVRLLVIEASGVTDVDFTGSQMLQKTIHDLRSRGTDIAIARLIVTHAQEAAIRSGLAATIGADHIFMSVDEAVHARA